MLLLNGSAQFDNGLQVSHRNSRERKNKSSSALLNFVRLRKIVISLNFPFLKNNYSFSRRGRRKKNKLVKQLVCS